MNAQLLTLTLTESRARDSYGDNVATLRTDDARRFRVVGRGYDLIGTVFGDWLGATYQDRLSQLDVAKYYEAWQSADGSTVMLDGSCGLISMTRIANAIGLAVREITDRRGHVTSWLVQDSCSTAEAIAAAEDADWRP